MAHPRKTFGPLLYGTLIVGVCVVLYVGLVRLKMWYAGEPGTPQVNLEAKVAALVPLVTSGDQVSRITAIHSLGQTLQGLAPRGSYVPALAALAERFAIRTR